MGARLEGCSDVPHSVFSWTSTSRVWLLLVSSEGDEHPWQLQPQSLLLSGQWGRVLPTPAASAPQQRSQDLQREEPAAWVLGTEGDTHRGDEDKGEKGLGAVPGRQAAFREGLALAVKYAKALGCPRIHLMAGRVPAGTERAAMALEMEATFIENLRYAADILAQEDMMGLLEPMNSRITDPRYFLTTPHQAAAILEKVGRPNLRLQVDIFHCQIMDGNLTQNLETYFPLIGHIQVGQVPGRHEPDSPGEVNFPYLFQLLESLGYEGYVGCEYTPQGDTLEGLGWLHAYWESRGRQQQRRC
ncbi:transmembrane emp24 domain-containing protein 9 [Platysternon megacephalum]|uniref:Transmembrane emp24 domain-containing protein 9 n=1 Tax=Platysternon megacephalum TaxID=55544 RepID=A0A4D9E490_9SAUR|nr:transmembrane emp24 domain-containing protein 9 [Platysternon megacephalum]